MSNTVVKVIAYFVLKCNSKLIFRTQALSFKASKGDHSPQLSLNHLPESVLYLTLADSISAS